MTLSPHLTPFSLKPTTSLRKSSAPKHVRNGTSTCSLACDGDSQGVCRAHARKASQSTDSDVSDLIDTDLTTPSPWRIGIDAPDDSDGISDLDDAELRLPPSVLGSEPASMPVTSGAIPLSIQSGTHVHRGPISLVPRQRFCLNLLHPPNMSSHPSFFIVCLAPRICRLLWDLSPKYIHHTASDTLTLGTLKATVLDNAPHNFDAARHDVSRLSASRATCSIPTRCPRLLRSSPHTLKRPAL